MRGVSFRKNLKSINHFRWSRTLPSLASQWLLRFYLISVKVNLYQQIWAPIELCWFRRIIRIWGLNQPLVWVPGAYTVAESPNVPLVNHISPTSKSPSLVWSCTFVAGLELKEPLGTWTNQLLINHCLDSMTTENSREKEKNTAFPWYYSTENYK